MIKVLVIDDDKTMNETLADCFDPDEFNITVKPTGSEGATSFEKDRPDIVILDIGLADIDGALVLETLKKIDPDVSVGVLSGYTAREEEMMQLGAQSYKTKPLTVEEMEEWFKELAGGKGE